MHSSCGWRSNGSELAARLSGVVTAKAPVWLQTTARNETEALEEARQAIEKIVLPTMKPIELLPRVKEVVAKQAALAESSFGLATEKVGTGAQCRLRILPSAAVPAESSVATL